MSGNDRRLTAVERRLSRLKLPTDGIDFTSYASDPVRFREEVLGFDSAIRRSDGSAYQDEILNAVQAKPRVAVVAGHGVGKTRSLAALALWWLVTRPFSRVVIVAPQFDRQIRGVLFAEIARLVRRARIPLPVEVQASRAIVTGYGAEWCIVGLPATEPDRIEGQHAEGGLLLILDETKGVSQESFDALLGTLTGGSDSRLVIASTPGGASGPFYRACSNLKGLWHVMRLSSEDSSIVSPQWCLDRANEWGASSALYQTRVQGCFADAGEGQLFSLSLLERACEGRGVAAGSVRLGVDVSRSVTGDENCICVVRNGCVERLTLWRSPDLMASVSRVIHEVSGTNAETICVDVGGVGAGVVDRLRQLRFKVEAVNFGGAASDASRFRNKRAEMYWQLREDMEAGRIRLIDDDDLIADLCSIRYSFDQAGRVLLEPKEDVRRRLGRSPDRADALALAVGGDSSGAQPIIVRPHAIPWETNAELHAE